MVIARNASIALCLLVTVLAPPSRAAPADQAGVATAVNTTALGLPPSGSEGVLDVGAAVIGRGNLAFDDEAAGAIETVAREKAQAARPVGDGGKAVPVVFHLIEPSLADRPHPLSVRITKVEKSVGARGGDQRRMLRAVLFHEYEGGAVDIEVAGHWVAYWAADTE
jgi:hypothetical protein